MDHRAGESSPGGVGWGDKMPCPEVNTVNVDALKPSDIVQGKLNTSTWILMSINLVDY